MKFDGVEGYDEELPSEVKLDGSETAPESDKADAGSPVPEDGALKDLFSGVVEDMLHDQELGAGDDGALAPEALEAVKGENGGESVEGPSEPEAALSEDAWQSYLLLQEQQHLEHMAHLETLRNLDLCVLVALGVVAGCLLMRQLSSFFR